MNFEIKNLIKFIIRKIILNNDLKLWYLNWIIIEDIKFDKESTQKTLTILFCDCFCITIIYLRFNHRCMMTILVFYIIFLLIYNW